MIVSCKKCGGSLDRLQTKGGTLSNILFCPNASCGRVYQLMLKALEVEVDE